ncbi:MAG: arginine--tRNA ligase [Alphaproteobacteria bacterium]|nr:arginine--tRNA ligase [Alphaproteobacteria bacterium]
MTSLTQKLSVIVGEAFEAQDLPRELGAVRVSDRPDLCQFQCNGAMGAAKQAKKNPREVAQGIVDVLAADDRFGSVEIAGPGFINLKVSDSYLQAHLSDVQDNIRMGIAMSGGGQTAVLDYGGMNVAKAMHVGHLRSLAIGDCLKRMMRFAGYEALGDIHLGDWGLQMGQIISEFAIRYPQWPYFDANFEGEYSADAPFEYSELEEVYPLASQACKDDEARLELARVATAELQNGRRGYVALWRHFIALSIADIRRNIEPLGIDFEIWKGESDVNDLIPEISDDLKSKGVLEESNGAQVIAVEREGDNKDVPPLMFFKSNGAATYGTTDLATIYDRVKTYPALTHLVYETDIRQNLHFEQVFRAAERAGYADDITLKHIGHGTINGTDGKPFKTREGKAMTFRDMVVACREKADARLAEANLDDDIDQDELDDIAAKVTCAALKFAELSNQAHMDYVFDLDRMTSFEGKTGPYVLYQAVRIQSLLKKAGVDTDGRIDLNITDADRSLALLLTELPDHFDMALKHYSPYVLCDYAYKIAQEFSSFYGNCHILSEEDEAIRTSRLALCALTHRQLVLVLELLGIEVPARM